MTQISDVVDHGLEVLKKSAIIPDDSYKTRYALRTQDERLVINESGQLKVVLDGKVDTNNSTKVLLGANQTFTGIASNTLDYAIIFVTVYANVASATDGLKIQFSSDGIIWHDGDVYTINANTMDETFSINPYRKFYRIVYVNGASNQTNFDLECILKKMNSKPSSHRIQDSIGNDDDGELVKSVLSGENSAAPGTFLNIKSTTGGNLRVTVDQVEPTTNSIKTMDYAHAELHAGDHYVIRTYISMLKNSTYDFLLLTPNTLKWSHIIREYDSISSSIIARLYEDTITSANGTIVQSYNRNRNSLGTSTLSVYHTPTVTSVGTLISSVIIGSGKGIGGSNRETSEIILKQNTKYLVRITEQNITDTFVNVLFDWYEHTNLA